MIASILLLGAGAAGSAEAADRLFAAYRTQTTVAVRCAPSAEENEVVVCGGRRADRYRLPLKVAATPGDPRHEGVPEERERLLGRTNNCTEMRAFQVGCGKAGVGLTVTAYGTKTGGLRDLSP